MKKILFLILTISIISCSNDDIKATKPDYSAFLSNRTPSFKGKLDTRFINWEYGWTEFQMSNGYQNGNGVCSVTDPVRILMFGLSTDDGTTQLNFITPKMDTSNPNDVKNVLSIGEKQFGDLYNKFQLTILKNNNFYINNPNTIQKLEILKTEQFQNYDGKEHILVWVKIDNLELENSNQSGEKLQLKNCYLIADLFGQIFE